MSVPRPSLRDASIFTEPVHSAFGSLEIRCPCLQNPALGNSAKKHSSYSAKPETGRTGAATLAKFVDGRLALSKLEGNGFWSGIGRQWPIRRARRLACRVRQE